MVILGYTKVVKSISLNLKYSTGKGTGSIPNPPGPPIVYAPPAPPPPTTISGCEVITFDPKNIPLNPPPCKLILFVTGDPFDAASIDVPPPPYLACS